MPHTTNESKRTRSSRPFPPPKTRQNRPNDFGVGERLSYAMQLDDRALKHELAIQISGWTLGIYKKLREERPREATQFVIALANTLHLSSPMLMVRMIKKGYYKDTLIALGATLLHPCFIRNYLGFCLFAFTKIRKSKL